MPRLDNSDPKVLYDFDLTFDFDDPGDTPAVDVCIDCVEEYIEAGVNTEVEHPPYEGDEGYYHCWSCGDNLYERDN